MIKAVEIIPSIDPLFWYTLSTVLSMALIAIVWRYVGKTEKLLEQLTQTVQNLVVNDKVQDEKIENLENPKIVKYRSR